MKEHEYALAEYRESLAHHRSQSTFQFGQLAIYLGSMAFLVDKLWSLPRLVDLDKTLGLVGAVVSMAFLIISERAGDFAYSSRKRAKAIEDSLHFKLLSEGPRPNPVFSAINGTRILYIGGLVFWIVTFGSACR